MLRHAEKTKGFALALVLITVSVATVIGMGYMYAATLRASGTGNLALSFRARYLAESGAQHALYSLRCDFDSVAGSSVGNAMGPYYVDGGEDSYGFYAIADGSGGYDIVSAGTAEGEITQSVTMTTQVTNLYSQQVISYSPLAYWRLGDAMGAWAIDVMANYHGVYANGVSRDQPGSLPGDNNGSAGFDGLNDLVDVGNIDVNGASVTFLAWFKVDDWDFDEYHIISKATSADPGDRYWVLGVEPDEGTHRLFFEMRLDGTLRDVDGDSDDIQAGEWIFAAAVCHGAEMVLYQNAEVVDTENISGAIDANNLVSAWIGVSPGSMYNPFDGLIDEVAIIPSALTAEQIQQLYELRRPNVKVTGWND